MKTERGNIMATLNFYTVEEQNKLIEDNMKLVYFIARKICKYPEMLDDCIQEGCLGLIRAAKYFDESRGVKFSTFAGFEIKCAIRSYLYRDKLIRIPSNYTTLINKLNRQIAQVQTSECRELSEFEIFLMGHELKIPDNVLYQVVSPVISLNNLHTDSEGSESEYINTLEDTSENIENKIETTELLNIIDDFMACVNSRNPKYVEIFKEYLTEVMEAAVSGDNVAENLLSIVRKYHPEFTVLESDDEETRKYKAKRLDSYYQSIRDFWNRNLGRLQEELINAGYTL